jgi:hypothetical protein
MIEISGEIFPVEIKAISANKSPENIAKEYYHKLQLHAEVTD